MTQPGFDNRLRQHSRRAGLMVGLSMALTIAVCIGSFAVIYARFEPFTRDFVDAATKTPTSKATRTAASADTPGDESDDGTSDQQASTGDDNEDVTPTEPSVVETVPTATPSSFQESYVVSSNVAVNLRSEPTRDSVIVTTLSPGTPLQYLNQQQEADNPAEDGRLWLKFRTEDGAEGWVRELDVEPAS